MTRRILLALAVGAGCLVFSAAGRATGDAPTTVGWWTATNPGGPVPTIVPSGQTRADVPDGGFEVSTASDAVSYAAVAYLGEEGTRVERLVLPLATDAAQLSGSKVQACPLGGSGLFTAADGGPLAEGPKYDCSSAAPGQDAGGNAVAFDVGRFANGSGLAVAVVGISPARLVFAKPGPSAVVVSGAPGTAGPPLEVPTETNFPADAPAVELAPPLDALSPLGTGPVSDTPIPSAPTGGVTGASGQASASGEPFAVTEAAATTRPGSAVIGFLLVLAGALALAVRNARRVPIASTAPKTSAK